MASYRENLLSQPDALEPHEVRDLRDWLEALRGDVDAFGETPEDTDRMARIEARISEAEDAPPPPSP